VHETEGEPIRLVPAGSTGEQQGESVKGTRDHRTGRGGEGPALHDDERFRTLADTAPAMLWVTQPDGSCSFLSRAWYEFTGQTEGAALGTGWLDAVHLDDRERSDAAFAAANAKRDAFALEYRLRRRDGTYRWVIDSGRARFDGERFMGYVGSVIDITERKRSELLDQEQKRVLELVAAGRPIEDCLRAIAEAATRLAPGTLACGVIVEPDLRRATPELAVHFPQALGEALSGASNDDGACHSTAVLDRGGRAIASFRLWLPEPRPPREWERRRVRRALRRHRARARARRGGATRERHPVPHRGRRGGSRRLRRRRGGGR
jgi:PAS domain S-box-containing protein